MTTTTEQIIADILEDAKSIEDLHDRAVLIARQTHGFSTEVQARLIDHSYSLVKKIEDVRRRVEARSAIAPHVERIRRDLALQEKKDA